MREVIEMGMIDENSISKNKDIIPIQIVQGIPHGSHWGCILDDLSKVALILDNILKGDGISPGRIKWLGYNDQHNREMENDTFGVIKGSGGVRSMVILVNNSIFTAFPFPTQGSFNEITITNVLQWENRIEGWLEVNYNGAELTVFDPYFYLHRGLLAKNQNLYFSALAYQISVRENKEIKISKKRAKEMGLSSTSISTNGMASIIPSGTNAPDDYAITMPIYDIKEVKIFDEEGFVFLGPVIRSDGEFILPVTALKRNIKGSVPKIGQDLFANIWLLGFLIELDFKFNGKTV